MHLKGGCAKREGVGGGEGVEREWRGYVASAGYDFRDFFRMHRTEQGVCVLIGCVARVC